MQCRALPIPFGREITKVKDYQKQKACEKPIFICGNRISFSKDHALIIPSKIKSHA
jgi:hypothetical protein